VEHAGAEVLDGHVGYCGEAPGQLGPAVGLEVDADVALPGVLLGVIARQPVADLAPPAGRVAFGRLDLHDVGPEVRQHPAGDGPGEHAGQVQDAHTVEGTFHRRPFLADALPVC